MSKVYCGNISWSTTEQSLLNEFTRYGAVTEAKIVTDKFTGRSKGFAFVTYETEEAATQAIAALDGQEFEGRALRVSVALERPRQPRGEQRGYGNANRDNHRDNRRGGPRYQDGY